MSAGKRQRCGRAWSSRLRYALIIFCIVPRLGAQELQPRAYIPAPDGLNYFGISYANNGGGFLVDESVPLQNAHVNANVVSLSFGQTLDVLGRTAQILVVVPYAVANVDARVSGEQDYLYRSGLGDAIFRYAMNLYGAPAMNLKQFMNYRQGTIVGASITVTAPSSQYDPARLINTGTNRWGFKPELGISRAIGKWTIEGAAGVWLFTTNDQYYGKTVLTEVPLGSFQTHLVRYLPHRTWAAFDGTYFVGARTQVDGQNQADYQSNIRLGATFGIALTNRQAIKITYFDGVITRAGAAIRSIGISYNLVWQKGRLPRD